MITNLFFCLPLRRSLLLKTLTHFHFNFSVLAETNVSKSNAPSENLFVDFVTTRFNMSSADAAKMLKSEPRLVRLKTLDMVEQLAHVLSRHGFTEYQTASIIRCEPTLMLLRAERLLEPKIEVLKDSGLGVEFITRFPRILTCKLDNLHSNLELLKTVFPTRDNLIRAITRNPYILSKNLRNFLKPSVAFWEDFGFHGIELTELFSLTPWLLTRSSLAPEQLDLIRKIGIHRESRVYKHVVSRVAVSRVEVLEAKIKNLHLCGLSPKQALDLVRADPTVLSKSEENIKNKMDFMLNHMGLSVNFVTKHPRMFTMSLDKVMRPRFLVLQNRAAKNGAGKVDPTRLYTMLMMTKAKFVGQIIQGHPESAALCTVYKNAIANVSKSSKI